MVIDQQTQRDRLIRVIFSLREMNNNNNYNNKNNTIIRMFSCTIMYMVKMLFSRENKILLQGTEMKIIIPDF